MNYLHVVFKPQELVVYQAQMNNKSYPITYQKIKKLDLLALIKQIKLDFPHNQGGILKGDALAFYSPFCIKIADEDVVDMEKCFAEIFNVPFVRAEALVDNGEETLKKTLAEKQQTIGWSIDYCGYNPGKAEYTTESLLTVANGYLGLRGTLPEMVISDDTYPATYLAGLYNQAISVIDDHQVHNEDFVNAPNAQYISLRIGQGKFVNLTDFKVISLYRRLDFLTGILSSELQIEDEEGRRLKIDCRKFTNMARMTHYSIEYQFCPLNFSDQITICTKTDGGTFNYGVERYRSLNSYHYEIKDLIADKHKTYLLARTYQSKIGIGISTEISGDFFAPDSVENRINENSIVQQVVFSAEQGNCYRLEKNVAIAISTVFKQDWQQVDTWQLPNFAAQLAESQLAWQTLWRESDIVIAGDMMAQKLLRLHTYHLLASCSPLTNGKHKLDVSVTARGLHGEAYRGHIFWDEIFILPFYIMHFPTTARQLLMYRYRRLPAAKQAASQAGYQGAMFPWQSGHDGSEQTQTLHINPLTGQWDPDHSHLQCHISLSIAYNVWLYWLNTGDKPFMIDYGLELLIEIAKFWLSKTAWDATSNRYHIAGVMGPDEFHEYSLGNKEAGLQDNAYTNLMVAWLFNQIDIIVLSLSKQDLNNILNRVDIDTDFWQQLTTIKENLALSINEQNIIGQFDGYFALKEIDWQKYRNKYGNIYRLDRILRAEGKSADNYKVAKQADLLMIFHNLSQDVVKNLLKKMNYATSDNYVEKNFNYYFSRTSHGSTLSRVVHASLAENIKLSALSWQLYKEALFSDYQDIQGGTTSEGIHTGVMAATLNMTIMTYGGVDIRQPLLEINPSLPSHWRHLQFKLCHLGVNYQFFITQEKLFVSCDRDTEILVNKQGYRISAGKIANIDYKNEVVA
ncbi:glycoside hydrolase family 65 protein [Arsenophonus nasoniae]|nr:glycoside hydrolase family 65 protein [Arsenophonus nasoniae]QBY45281.1 Trehalose 6-phosphate phosphorylase [Arsenophonus nasoniae]WGM01268.1 glycoside hydrolase family 65 protein [Arsenophonus nasoniae]WGM05453.1 glycoside hydrolase family 65 protein [Arsenophonus nasoniae]WGM10464.1 glycoside hydrolase family 65 protein [Arsenophonus nasoniae]WGM15172.1 glycoside hydrolase family 65 protein [Arsenophonus nasoniae]